MSTSCARIAKCPLFAAFSMKSSLRVWRTYYCEGEFTRCERLMLAETGAAVSPKLLPNGRILEGTIDQLKASDMA